MVEISKEAKIIVIINMIVSFIFAFFFLGIPEIYRDLTGSAFFSPITWRQLGGTLLVLGIFAIIALRRKEWEQIRIFWEIGIAFLIMLVCIDIWVIIRYLIFDYTVIVEIVLIAVNIFFYLRERK
ncbi:MAG: hypothetical protein ACXABG_01885 [Promethearchaeota archaeon]|jgi:hypothetical protein